MTTILLMLIPPAALAIFAAWRALRGRPLRRHELNLLYALLLLGYFLATAGLGIFWVANQELPVFDIHYLFGYLTLALVLIHLAFNWRAVLAFLRRRAPSVALTPDGRSWRPAVRLGGWILGLALFGVTCFWLGLRQGASRVEVIERTVTAPPRPAVAEEVKDSEMATPGEPRPVPRQMVVSEGREMPLADYYHEETKHSRTSVMGKSSGLDFSRQPRVFKEYPEAEVIPLPRDLVEDTTSTGDAIESRRQPVPSLAPGMISLRDVSTLLQMANGVTATRRYPGRTYHLRSAPSAGALYPTVTYLLIRQVEGIDPGLYHYGVKGHELRRVRAGADLIEDLAVATGSGHLVRDAGAVFLFSSIYFRSSWKYGERAYRYCLMDAGHVAENLMLAAAALDYAAVPIGRFDDRGVNRLLGIDDRDEGALLVVPVGQASEEDPPAEDAAFEAQPERLGGDDHPILLLAHGRTYLGLTGGKQVYRSPGQLVEDKPYPNNPVIELPEGPPKGAVLFPSILGRRSIRKWRREGMTLDQLSSLLYHAFGIRDGEVTDPSVESTHPLRLYLIVNRVEGLDAGVYYYRRHDHALSLIEEGDFRRRSHAISLFQDVVGDSGVALVMTIDGESLGTPDGDRGYRYACMDAGMLGGRLYLQAGALGLGCCGIGAFFDDEVAEVIGVDPKKEMVIYMAATGVKAE